MKQLTIDFLLLVLLYFNEAMLLGISLLVTGTSFLLEFSESINLVTTIVVCLTAIVRLFYLLITKISKKTEEDEKSDK